MEPEVNERALVPQTPTITEDDIKKIEAALASGQPFRTACALAGVKTPTAQDWLREGANGHPSFVDFYERCQKAMAVHQMQLQQIVQKSAMAGNVKDAQWLLERRYPTDYGRPKEDAIIHGEEHKVVIQLEWPGSNVIDAESELQVREIEEAQVVDDGDEAAAG